MGWSNLLLFRTFELILEFIVLAENHRTGLSLTTKTSRGLLPKGVEFILFFPVCVK